MFQYLLQVIIFQLVFLLVYELFLKKETFFTANRWYLLVTPVIAMLLPFLHIPYFADLFPQEVVPVANQNLMMPEVLIETTQPGLAQTSTARIPVEESLNINWWLLAYVLGITISLALFFKRWRILWKLFQFKTETKKDFKIIEIPNSKMAFTFLRTIFLGSEISAEDREQILEHELIHVSQKHSLDLVFFEILKVVFWFNPLVYIFQNRIALLHEFIADEEVVKRTSKKQYFNQLLNSAFETQNLSFTNQFFDKSLIKKRIVMLQKRKSGQLSKLKFLLLIPAIAMMLVYVSCSNEERSDVENNLEEYTYVVKKGEAENRTAESLAIQEKSEEFLMENNEDYVLWSTIDYTEGSVTYTVHSKEETVPQDYSSHTISKDGEVAYTMYMNLKSKPVEEMEPGYNSLKEVLITDGIPYEKVNYPPVFGSCTSITDEEQRKACTQEKISNYVLRNFNTNLGKELGLEGLTRIIVQFKISADGAITEVRARAPQPELEKEAIKIIKSMPMLIPSQNKPTPHTSVYSLPITFQVQA
ncbi:M56 family metallopeptidase [Zunongwangia atlantica]|uniref:BlaR1 peptidase M56 n=1 Tax=Zunongwangia atlantica 22II14-10F7 TaxID=1185767 RepID=A0A1Y1T6U7_9FLAO|nr:M56 family metallopeptidase [Zunongwangia atlantica]ORL46766.1 blaR1 peptidase M56 [Zunongwangia atlantica 22II14-10F7]